LVDIFRNTTSFNESPNHFSSIGHPNSSSFPVSIAFKED